jgi:hypothetical protein
MHLMFGSTKLGIFWNNTNIYFAKAIFTSFFGGKKRPW